MLKCLTLRHKIKKEDKDEEENDNPESDNDDTNINIEHEMNQQKFERDKAKYRSEVKFHYLITESGELGKALPEILEVQNPYPGEPRFLRKRRHPKALRLYKVKRDLNPERFFLHELMMYKNFGPEDYERWHDDKKCMEDYERFKDDIK